MEITDLRFSAPEPFLLIKQAMLFCMKRTQTQTDMISISTSEAKAVIWSQKSLSLQFMSHFIRARRNSLPLRPSAMVIMRLFTLSTAALKY
jgi:hypothetical protein